MVTETKMLNATPAAAAHRTMEGFTFVRWISANIFLWRMVKNKARMRMVSTPEIRLMTLIFWYSAVRMRSYSSVSVRLPPDASRLWTVKIPEYTPEVADCTARNSNT